MDTDSDVTMSLGAPAKLYCLAYGFPKPTVTHHSCQPLDPNIPYCPHPHPTQVTWWKGTTMLALNSERHAQEEFTLSFRYPPHLNMTVRG